MAMTREPEKKLRYRISYVLPLQANADGGHRLGVNGLAVDSEQSILYSGGRDGVVCAWNLNHDIRHRASLYDTHRTERSSPDPQSAASAAGVLARTTTGESTSSQHPPTPASTLRRKVQAHTHWINDISLVHHNQAVVSAGSDRAIKLWRPTPEPYPLNTPSTIGVHGDYVKALASPGRDSTWIASGGLDKRVSLWDITGKGEILGINVAEQADNQHKASVYSVAATRNLIAAGGPDSIVRLWDARSGKRVTRFVGHTDLIRSILIAEDGETVMTASSDSTVKLWDMGSGRCDHTLTMHNESVWRLYSEDPKLKVFWSSDMTGLVAKTDWRGKAELDEGACVAVCHEAEGVSNIVAAGGYIWTAIKKSSINRWLDVPIEETESIMTETASMHHRGSIMTLPSRTRGASGSISQYSNPFADSPRHNSPAPPVPGEMTRQVSSGQVSARNVLRLSVTAPFPIYRYKDVDTSTLHSTASIRRPTEPFDNDDGQASCVRTSPDHTIEGQHGLSKHVLLNNKRKVLAIDTAGEVTMWDLIKCVPIQCFGKRDLDDVLSEVNTSESVAHWCTVDTRMGALTCTLEDHSCFEAEMYADEYEEGADIEFKEDQRINLGKWVLRYIFDNFLNEEIRRDEEFRRNLYLHHHPEAEQDRPRGPPGSIKIPSPRMTSWLDTSSTPGSASTLRAINGYHASHTPGLSIGLATPAPPLPGSPDANNFLTVASIVNEPGGTHSNPSSARNSSEGRSSDYFTSRPLSNGQAPSTPGALAVTPGGSTTQALGANTPLTPSTTAASRRSHDQPPNNVPGASGTTLVPSEGGEAATTSPEKSNFLGKMRGIKFMPKGFKKTDKANDSKLPATEERSTDLDPNASALADEVRDKDLFYHTLTLMQTAYENAASAHLPSTDPNPAVRFQNPLLSPAEATAPGLAQTSITPSLPNETPVLKLPPHMVILLQAEKRDSSGVGMGVTDLWEGTVGSTGADADVLERVAPGWLATLLLRNVLPMREVPKISFMLEPWGGLLPRVCVEANTRLNANRMLRARKIMGYVAERIEPINESEAMKAEDYLELYCNEQLIHPMMTLGTIRAYTWRSGTDILFHYKANGQKQILHCPQATAGLETPGTSTQERI
ncbi:WD40 repeat-like protein [Microthyrium microscopicum]|uniref:WD40 repeat-like protein n=1 Tax=Microthyrium microscopicum TaxID=703497 RepID=A0A6A6U898_9PEZI|nr:WD40 repeat-like protein [Microthyrium microscopicum]